MVSVGVLAALINAVILIVVAIADYVIQRTIRNFATSRLFRYHRAPVVHDSDTWLPFLPKAIFKYYRNPAILCTILCTILVIASEFVSEIGVNVSRKCRPQSRNGPVIAPDDVSKEYTSIELASTCLVLQRLKFEEGNLTSVQSGIPRQLTSMTCLSCLPKTNKYIVGNCTVTKSKRYKAGQLKIGVNNTKKGLKNITTMFIELNGSRSVYSGYGDLTFNGDTYSTFIVAPVGKELIYLEYNDQKHVKSLKEKAVKGEIFEITKSKVDSYKVKCEQNMLSEKRFAETLQIYRTVQLENPISPVAFSRQTGQDTTMISADDVYRAVLSVKIIDDRHDDKEYFEYTECAFYSYKFVIPMMICLVLLAILAIFSYVLKSKVIDDIAVPYNSRSWYGHAYELQEEMRCTIADEKGTVEGSSYFDEVVLLEEGFGDFRRRKVEIRSGKKRRRRPAEVTSHNENVEPRIRRIGNEDYEEYEYFE